jgi:FAD/FMN-containing dehydrogenase
MIMKTAIVGSSTLSIAQDLRAAVRGRVVVDGDEAYTEVRQIWNGAIEDRPALFVLCETVEDVQASVRTARAHNLPLSVRGGGHDPFGRALRAGGLVIDLTAMRHVDVDEVAKVATVAGGATVADVSAAADPHQLVAVTANVGAVGMAGFLLGGGYGPLTTRFGLAVDNLLGAELVLADGRRVWADASENDDLFWALRGGGGNFGVVTSMKLRLHSVSRVLAGLIVFPWAEAENVLRGFAETLSSASDELSALAVVLPMPDGSPAMFLGPIWSGDLDEGERVMTHLKSLGSPVMTQIAPMSYTELVHTYDSQVRNGRHYGSRTRWFADLSPEVISILIAGGTARTSPFSILALHHLHGAPARVLPDATAFGMRQKHYMLEIVPAWEPNSPDEASTHWKWASDLSSVLAPFALPGGYANFLGPEDREQIPAAYGGNARRLREVKLKFDPDNVFSSATPLPI